MNPGKDLFRQSRSSDPTPLFFAGLHRFKTSVRQGVGSFELLFDQQIFFRQLQECRSVSLQVLTEEAQHFSRSYQILSECTQDRFLGWRQRISPT